ncbi:MAG TPA: LysR family transcriptional regulator [Thermoanaerobaculia bacterium]|nr:LysR family transcriptional regulator [Thermoanaerobaculia bacterium]
MPTRRPPSNRLHPRLRVLHGEEIALGPGKVDLLEAVRSTGSLAQAARALGLSYMRAWKLVQTMNACFREPLVVAARGGRLGGGAHLTPTGEAALALYRAMERSAQEAAEPAWRELRRHLLD